MQGNTGKETIRYLKYLVDFLVRWRREKDGTVPPYSRICIYSCTEENELYGPMKYIKVTVRSLYGRKELDKLKAHDEEAYYKYTHLKINYWKEFERHFSLKNNKFEAKAFAAAGTGRKSNFLERKILKSIKRYVDRNYANENIEIEVLVPKKAPPAFCFYLQGNKKHT